MFRSYQKLKTTPKSQASVLSLVLMLLVQWTIGPGTGVAETLSPARTLLNLPVPGTMVHSSESFDPLMIKGITVNHENPLQFGFVVDKGSATFESDTEYLDETRRLVKYFLTSLTIPEDELWVNLSPYEDDRIIPESFGMGAQNLNGSFFGEHSRVLKSNSTGAISDDATDRI